MDVIELARSQDDAVTVGQALELGLNKHALQHRVEVQGWTRPVRGALVVPPVADLVRAHARAAVLAVGPHAVVAGGTAARLHGLDLPERHTPDEPVELVLPRRLRRAQRRGVRLRRVDVPAEDRADLEGIPALTVRAAVRDLLEGDDRRLAVCAADSALRTGALRRADLPESPWTGLVDGRAESVLETLGRLLLHDAGLMPEELQGKIYDAHGHFLARGDALWRSRKLLVEFDGKGPHELPAAVLRDRERQNALANAGWRVLRFTWYDVLHRPSYVISRVRQALTAAA